MTAARPAYRPVSLVLAVCGWLVALLAVTAPACAQGAVPIGGTPAAVATAPAGERLEQARLEGLLAPIALYPDSLLAQVLMAATYPLEIVEARRWLGEGSNAQLRGDALARALEERSWDPSVKSLVPFPDVLSLLNDHLDWTQQLGDAVLAQQAEVLNAVQLLRARAQAAGTLASGPQQTVTVTQIAAADQPAPAASPAAAPPQQVIVIKPTQPDTVYVPVYDPSAAYGTWPYPQAPPVYYPPPPGAAIGTALFSGMAFAGGVAIVGSLWDWASPGWRGGDVNINVNRFNQINASGNRIDSPTWRHDAVHRHGVAYRDESVRARFRSGDGPDRVAAREQFRGRVRSVEAGGTLAEGGRRGGAERRPTLDRRTHAASGRPHLAQHRHARPAAREGRAASGGVSPASHGDRGWSGPQGLQGLGEARQVHAASARGRASRLAANQAGAHLGGGHAAGGRHQR